MIVCVLSLLALVAQAKLKTTWDVTDYVQDGLIANYDGIKNAGKDNPHDSTRNEWVDLVSGGTAKLVFPDSTKDSGEWKDTGYRFEGGSYFETPAKLTLGNEFTVQLVTDTDMSRIDASHQYPAMWACGEFSIYLIHTSDTNVEKKNIAWKEDSYTDTNQSDKTTRRPIFQWDAKYVNAAFDAEYSYMVQTPYWIDEEKNRFERKDPATVSAQNYTWGGRKSGGKNGQPLNANCCSRGMIYAWRAYSRKLTNEELAWNRQVDEIRFRGSNMPPATNIVIEADSLGLNGTEPAGAYVVDGEHTFTAESVTIGGKTYDTVCVMDIGHFNHRIVIEQYLDQNGRTILWRRFNKNDWAFSRYGKLWTELLPDNERLTVNGETYVHWYDCVSDYIF
jgi:hypothetical protein